MKLKTYIEKKKRKAVGSGTLRNPIPNPTDATQSEVKVKQTKKICCFTLFSALCAYTRLGLAVR